MKTLLDYTVANWPIGSAGGHFSPWKTNWRLPPGTPTGYIIQEIQLKFTGVTECGGAAWDDNTIWYKIGFDGNTRLHWWEAWQHRGDGVIELDGSDAWDLPQNSDFYRILTSGTFAITAKAAFYQVDLSGGGDDGAKTDLNNLGGDWGRGYEDSEGSPGSGRLFSTIVAPSNLPDIRQVTRTLTATWNSCDSPEALTNVVIFPPKSPTPLNFV